VGRQKRERQGSLGRVEQQLVTEKEAGWLSRKEEESGDEEREDEAR
jgi:hypothetical protein